MSELQQAINNNVAPYLQSLFSKIVYEAKVVNSVLVAGIRKYGTSQTVQVGTNKNGTAKMKTIVNKFAVLDLYIPKDDGGRSKLKTIVLGPTNALSFQPTANDLAAIASVVTQNVVTTNTDDISVVASNTPTSVVAPAAGATGSSGQGQGAQQQLPSKKISILGGSYDLYTADGIDTYIYAISRGYVSPISGYYPKVPLYGVEFDVTDANQLAAFKATLKGEIMGSSTALQSTGQGSGANIAADQEAHRESNQTQTGSVGTTQPIPLVVPLNKLPSVALSASTLYDFYKSQGLSLPSLNERAQIYQSLGLGQAAFYVGSAEQNTKLLQKLKYG
jgi:hypothetical protein